MKKGLGFTLIELLIVVLIIAILAAIAVPNFLEFQTRAKISRIKSDIRNVATALEAYAVDYSDYPPVLPDGNYRHLYLEYITQLSTPVAYISTVALADPFTPDTFQWATPLPDWQGSFNYFRYDNFWARGCYNSNFLHPGYAVFSNGPLRAWSWIEHYPYFKLTGGSHSAGGITFNIAEDTVYDPSNGTVSFGGIARFGGIAGISQTP